MKFSFFFEKRNLSSINTFCITKVIQGEKYITIVTVL